MVTCDRIDSNGPCVAPNNDCPEPGYACDTGNNWCCPMIMGNAVGPCITGAGGTRLCPEGYACSGAGVGNCFRLVYKALEYKLITCKRFMLFF